MKNQLSFIAVAVFALASHAQISGFTLQHFDNKKPGPVSIYSGSRLLGITDSLGYLDFDHHEWFIDIVLVQNQRELNYILVDTTYSTYLGGGKDYILQIVPETTEEAVVRAIRASEREPHTKTEITAKQLADQNTGRDIPVLLQNQPSVIVTSDAGNGVGYTGIRVRGSDASRTNITVNGVPINDAESQSTFWVNMPDLASSVQSIQLQRGVGSSTNGAGAFGASVNIQTATSFKPYGLISQSLGSFNTQKTTLAAGTGLMNEHWTLDMRLSQIKSDGYIDRATSNLQSWFVSGGYFARKWSIKFLSFSGDEQTYQAWYGIPREKLVGNSMDLNAHYNRNVPLIYRNQSDSANLFGSNSRTYNYYQYKNETDNYKQAHYHLYYNRTLNPHHSLNATLYRTNGQGYFEQFRPNDLLSSYNIPNAIFNTDTITNSDIIRRRWLDNTLTGLNANWLYKTKKLSVTTGGGYSQYFGNHFGEIVWARVAPAAEHLANYYNATGDKFDGNIFSKAVWNMDETFQVSADMQLRRVYHKGRGFDNDQRPIRFVGDFLFFNPKLGLSKILSPGISIYTSVAMANKEPARSDFTDNNFAKKPQPEKLLDYEFGYVVQKKVWNAAVNVYFMDYKNQLVLTGAVNDVGTPLRANVQSSYRAGVELSGSCQFNKSFAVLGNLTFSKNNIKEIIINTTDYLDNSVSDTLIKNVPLSYSPGLISSISFVYEPRNNWKLIWMHKYVGKQYLDNTGNEDKVLNAYYFSELTVSKSWQIGKALFELKGQVLNMFNAQYNNNGYAFEYLYGKGNLTREVYYFPSAPRNYMISLSLKF